MVREWWVKGKIVLPKDTNIEKDAVGEKIYRSCTVLRRLKRSSHDDGERDNTDGGSGKKRVSVGRGRKILLKGWKDGWMEDEIWRPGVVEYFLSDGGEKGWEMIKVVVVLGKAKKVDRERKIILLTDGGSGEEKEEVEE
ncbi:hypothetical protein Pcinc_033494 [Petrolisthes cinctipes]|uniref:Uncharacterized protein n=1 Tax=Petrolisthes cinctipes TaxID=88211 RepID=A0AAE1ES59_PETCI|nr:hypothetical protein Pcinc_033494 [Petrolisthes cinctipes]